MHAALSDFLLDIGQNAIEANAKNIILTVKEDQQFIDFTVKDDGKGMSEEVKKRVTDPFYTDGFKHEKRKVGLGIPFLIQAVEAVNGQFSLESKLNEGTTVFFRFAKNHIDCPPIGDFVSTFLVLLTYKEDFQMIISRSLILDNNKESYQLDKLELLELLGDFSTIGNLKLLKSYVQSQEAALDEIRK
jgi:hypothetical protein